MRVEVGLDPDATIQEFIAQFPNDSITAGHPTTDRGEDYVSVENDRRMAGTFLWLIGLSLPIAGVVLHFATAGRSVEPQGRSAAECDDACCRGGHAVLPGSPSAAAASPPPRPRRATAARSRRRTGGRQRRPPPPPRRGRAGRGRSADGRAVGQAAVLGVGVGRRRKADRSAAAAGRAADDRGAARDGASPPATRRRSR